jgi:hypothetical protein
LDMNTGAEDVTTLYRITNRVIDELVDDTWVDKTKSGRALQTLGIRLPLSYLDLIQHEYFGHGARAREFGMNVYYERSGLGATVIPTDGYSAKKLEPRALEKFALFAGGGLEAEGVMAAKIAQSGQVEPARFMLYGGIKSLQTIYFLHYGRRMNMARVRGANSGSLSGGGTDLVLYQEAINNRRFLAMFTPEQLSEIRYDYHEENGQIVGTVPPEQVENYKYIKGGQLTFASNSFLRRRLGDQYLKDETFYYLGAVNLVDPALWYSLYQDYKYIADGETVSQLPLIMPRTSIAFPVKGPEASLAVTIHDGETMVEPYIRATIDAPSWGWGIKFAQREELSGPIFRSLDLSAQGHSWEEPKGLGYAFGAGAVLNTTANFGLGGEFICKSEGDLPAGQYGKGCYVAINAKVYY